MVPKLVEMSWKKCCGCHETLLTLHACISGRVNTHCSTNLESKTSYRVNCLLQQRQKPKGIGSRGYWWVCRCHTRQRCGPGRPWPGHIWPRSCGSRAASFLSAVPSPSPCAAEWCRPAHLGLTDYHQTRCWLVVLSSPTHLVWGQDVAVHFVQGVDPVARGISLSKRFVVDLVLAMVVIDVPQSNRTIITGGI